jgi:hypothetical protein
MKTLADQFTRAGFHYQLVKREKDIACYSQNSISADVIVGYEVIRVQHREEELLPDGTLIEAGEYIPPTSVWGRLARTFYSLERAMEEFNELINSNESETGKA